MHAGPSKISIYNITAIERSWLARAAHLDSPQNSETISGEYVKVSGWILAADENARTPRIVIEYDNITKVIPLSESRPDAIQIVLEKKTDKREKCGFSSLIPRFRQARIFLESEGRRILWKEIDSEHVDIIKEEVSPRNQTNAHNLELNLNKVNISFDPVHSINSQLFEMKTLKGETWKAAIEKATRIDLRVNNFESINSFDLPFSIVPGDLYTISTTSGGTRKSNKFAAGIGNETFRGFVDLEIPRDDFSILDIPTEDLMSSGSDLLNLKRLIIRLRRAKRAHGGRIRFLGIPHRYVDEDLQAIRRMSSQYFSVINDAIGPRFIWSIVDCFADFGEERERLAAVSVSNVLHVERMAQSLNNVYSLSPISSPHMNTQIQYWGEMGTNNFSADDSLDVFLTRAIEVVSVSPLILGYFASLITFASAKESLLGINLRLSENFRNSYKFYDDFFKAHIAKLDAYEG